MAGIQVDRCNTRPRHHGAAAPPNRDTIQDGRGATQLRPHLEPRRPCRPRRRQAGVPPRRRSGRWRGRGHQSRRLVSPRIPATARAATPPSGAPPAGTRPQPSAPAVAEAGSEEGMQAATEISVGTHRRRDQLSPRQPACWSASPADATASTDSPKPFTADTFSSLRPRARSAPP
jgi:hypothetical protein